MTAARQIGRPAPPRPDELRELLRESQAAELAGAALAVLLQALLATRAPPCVTTERAFLRTAIRGDVPLGIAPPFTGARLAIWRAWYLLRSEYPLRGPRWQVTREAITRRLGDPGRDELDMVDGTAADDETWATVADDTAAREGTSLLVERLRHERAARRRR